MKRSLTWTGPFSISEFLASADNRIKYRKAGVYLWELPGTDGNYRVVYAGKANDLWFRQLEHYWHQIGGAYKLPKDFRACKQDWTLDLSRKDVCDTLFNVEKLKMLVAENFHYLATMRLHFAFTEDTRIVEANLIYDLQPEQNTRGKSSIPSTFATLEHNNAMWQRRKSNNA